VCSRPASAQRLRDLALLRRQAAPDGGDTVLRGRTGDQADQESRSAGPRAAPRLTAMAIMIHASFLPHGDPDASLAFHRDTLGFERRIQMETR
jgi:hypothetical protein